MVRTQHFRRHSLEMDSNNINDNNGNNDNNNDSSSDWFDFSSSSAVNEFVASANLLEPEESDDDNIFGSEFDTLSNTWDSPSSSSSSLFEQSASLKEDNSSENKCEKCELLESEQSERITHDNLDQEVCRKDCETAGDRPSPEQDQDDKDKAAAENEKQQKSDGIDKKTAAIVGVAVVAGGAALLSNEIVSGDNEDVEKAKSGLTKAAKLAKKFADDDENDVSPEDFDVKVSRENALSRQKAYNSQAQITANNANAQFAAVQNQAQMTVARNMALQAASNLTKSAAYVATATTGTSTGIAVATASAATAFTLSSTTTAITAAMLATTAVAATLSTTLIQPRSASTFNTLCNNGTVNSSVHDGKIMMRLASIYRPLTTDEKGFLSDLTEEVYNEVMGGCQDAYQRFGSNFEVLNDSLIIDDDGNVYLDTTFSGTIECGGCDPYEAFFGTQNATTITQQRQSRQLQPWEVIEASMPMERRLTEEKFQEFVQTMEFRLRGVFTNGGGLVYFVELNTQSGKETPKPVGICSIDPEIYLGEISIRLSTNRTLTAEEKDRFTTVTEGVYLDTMGGCDDTYERYGNNMVVINETLITTDDQTTFLDVVLSGIIQCEDCNPFEPFFGAPSSAPDDYEDGKSPPEKFNEFSQSLNEKMDKVFIDDQEIYFLAELNTATGEFGSGKEFSTEFSPCDFDLDRYTGRLLLRLASIQRELNDDEKITLATTATEVYNEGMGGCDDIFQRFGSDIAVDGQELVSEGDILFLDVTFTGTVRCKGCDEFEPFFGIDTEFNDVFDTDDAFDIIDETDRKFLDFVSIMADRSEGTFSSDGDRSKVVYFVELNGDSGEESVPVGVCNIDPDIYKGELAIRFYINRTLSEEETNLLSLATEEAYTETSGGCNDVYGRYTNTIEIVNETLVTTANGLTFLDLEISGLVQCDGCNSEEPFFGTPPNASDTNSPSAQENFAEFASALQTKMDEVFSTSTEKDVVHIAEVNTVTGEFGTGVQILPDDFCDVDPDIFTGSIRLRLANIQRVLSDDEKKTLATTATEVYNVAMGGCDDIFQRFGSDIAVDGQALVSEGDISFLDVTFTGTVRCRGCNATTPFFGVNVEFGDIINIKNETDSKFLDFVSIMADRSEGTFSSDGDRRKVVYFVELNGDSGEESVPVGVCNIDPDIYKGELAIRFYINRTLSEEETNLLSLATEEVYTETSGGCNDVYGRYTNTIEIVNETLVTTANGLTFLDLEISGLVQCDGCNSEEPFFGTPPNASDTNSPSAQENFAEFASALQTKMDEVFSTSTEKDVVHIAEVNTVTGEFGTGVQILPDDFCDVDPDIFTGSIRLRLANIQRVLSDDEKKTLATTATEVYNVAMGGCDDIFQRFGSDIAVDGQALVSEGDISFLDVTFTGTVRCRGCNATTPFFGVNVEFGDIINIKNETDSKFLDFVSIMADRSEGTFSSDGDRRKVVYFVELNGDSGEESVPVGVCNIDPDIYKGELAIRFYINRTLSEEETNLLSLATEEVYTETSGGCNDVYGRYTNTIEIVNETLVTTANGLTFLDLEISGLVQCDGCNSEEPFFGTPPNASDTNSPSAQENFAEFASALQTKMDEVFSTSTEKDVVHIAEVNTVTGEFGTGVQILPDDFCDVDPDIFTGSIRLRLANIQRVLSDDEKKTLATTATEVYNVAMGGCDDIFQRFGSDIAVDGQALVSEGDISFLDVTFTGTVRCRGCNATTPFFGVNVEFGDIINIKNETDSKFLDFVSIMADRSEGTFSSDGDRRKVVYFVELNGDSGEESVPVGVCNIDPDIYKGELAIRFYINRTLSEEETNLLSLATEEVYTETSGGCNDVYGRYTNTIEIVNETLVTTANGLTFLDLEISGLVQCDGCNSEEPFFGTPPNASDTNSPSAQENFAEFASALQTKMETVFGFLIDERDIEFLAEINTGTGVFGTSLQRSTMSPTESASIYPTSIPSFNPSNLPSLSPSTKLSGSPTLFASKSPSQTPTHVPSVHATFFPSSEKSLLPFLSPSSRPSSYPSTKPSLEPSLEPSSRPSISSSTIPSMVPSLSSSSSSSSIAPTTKSSLEPSPSTSSTPSISLSMKPSQNSTLATTCDPSTLQIVHITEIGGGGANACSKPYDSIPIIVDKLLKGDDGSDCISFSFQQTLRTNGNLQFAFFDYLSCESNSLSPRCLLKQAIPPNNIMKIDESAKCLNGFAEINVYARDNNWYLNENDTALIPDYCGSHQNPEFKCGWKFLVSCTC